MHLKSNFKSTGNRIRFFTKILSSILFAIFSSIGKPQAECVVATPLRKQTDILLSKYLSDSKFKDSAKQEKKKCPKFFKLHTFVYGTTILYVQT